MRDFKSHRACVCVQVWARDTFSGFYFPPRKAASCNPSKRFPRRETCRDDFFTSYARSNMTKTKQCNFAPGEELNEKSVLVRDLRAHRARVTQRDFSTQEQFLRASFLC